MVLSTKWSTVTEYACPTMVKDNQIYNPEPLLAFSIDELTLQWILWHRSCFVLSSSLGIAFRHGCFSSCPHIKTACYLLACCYLFLYENRVLAKGNLPIQLLVVETDWSSPAGDGTFHKLSRIRKVQWGGFTESKCYGEVSVSNCRLLPTIGFP